MFKLTIECKNHSELLDAVNKLGGHTERGTVEVSNDNKSSESESLTPKQKLIKEAESLGLNVSARDTMSDIEQKIQEAKTGVKPEVQVQTPINNAIPSLGNTQQAGNPFPQQQNVNPFPQQQVAPAAPAFNRQEVLNNIVAKLQACAAKGMPESQILPLVNQALQQVGAPVGVRLSEQEDHHLQNAYPGILSLLDTQLQAAQSSSFV